MSKSRFSFLTLAIIALLALAGAGCTAKLKASYHLKRAEKYYADGQLGSAEIEYKNVLHVAPENAEAWSRLGLIFFDEGRAAEAFPVLSRAEQLDSSNLEVRLKLGTIYIATGQLKAARDEANFVLARRPQDARAPLLLADTVTNDFDVYASQLQQLQKKGDSAPLEVALGTLAFRQMNLKAAEADFKRAISLDPKSSDAYTSLGGLYVAQKDMKQAEAAFKNAADFSSPWTGNGVRYAQFKIFSGDTVGGEQVLQDIVKKAPEFLPAWMTLAQLATARKDYTNGLMLLQNVTSRDPQNFDALLLRGRLELMSGKTTEAISGLEQMSKLYPQASTVSYALAQAYLVNNQTNEANANLIQALKSNPQNVNAALLLAETQIQNGNAATAIVSLRQLLQQQPQLVQAGLLLADGYRAQGNVDAAIRIYQQLEKSYPKSPQIPFLLGGAFVMQKQNAEARAAFEKSLELQPDYLPAVEQLVNLDLDEKQYPAALQRVQQMAVKNPNQAVLQLLLGKIFAAEDETNQAESALSKAIMLQPNSQTAYLMLALLYAVDGQNQKALENLKTALSKEPNDVAALMQMGVIYDSEKDYEDARDAYEKLLAITPDNDLVLNNLACDYADHLNQLDKAYPLAQRARANAPDDPSVADTLGWILYRRGEYASAQGLLQQSASKLDAIPVIQFHLGMIDYALGNEANARSAFQRALQLAGKFDEKAECQQRLTILSIDPQKADTNARALLEKWVADHPDDSIALKQLASIYQANGMSDKAIAVYESILKTNPQNVNALVNLAKLYAPTDTAKAFSYAKSAYQLIPTDPEIAYLAGHLALTTGDNARALTLLQFAVQSPAKTPEMFYDLGQAFYDFGKVADARTATENALQIQPAFADADNAKRFLRMIALAENPAQAVMAETEITGILKATPNYLPALMLKAIIAEQKSDLTAAQKTYESILGNYPDFAPAQKQLAILYAKDSANDAKAYPLAVKARAAFPSDAMVAKTLGIIVLRRGDYAQADSLLLESARQMTQDPELFYYLGTAQYHLKQNAESKAALQRALTLNLPDAQAVEARRMLADLK